MYLVRFPSVNSLVKEKFCASRCQLQLGCAMIISKTMRGRKRDAPHGNDLFRSVGQPSPFHCQGVDRLHPHRPTLLMKPLQL